VSRPELVRFTVQRFEGLRAILAGSDGNTIETVAARLPLGARLGSVIHVPTENGRPDWAEAVLEPVRD